MISQAYEAIDYRETVLVKKYGEVGLLFISSGDFMKAYIETLRNRMNPRAGYELGRADDLFNGSITRLKGYSGENWKISSYNDYAHLEGEPELVG